MKVKFSDKSDKLNILVFLLLSASVSALALLIPAKENSAAKFGLFGVFLLFTIFFAVDLIYLFGYYQIDETSIYKKWFNGKISKQYKISDFDYIGIYEKDDYQGCQPIDKSLASQKNKNDLFVIFSLLPKDKLTEQKLLNSTSLLFGIKYPIFFIKSSSIFQLGSINLKTFGNRRIITLPYYKAVEQLFNSEQSQM
jgi:hypothetical protein